jgi:hypothetical protein
MDHEQIREFLMISLGVAPSETFTPTYARIVLERVWRVLNVHSEFRDLRTRDKRAIFGIVGPLGFALIVAKQENNSCAMKQLKVICSSHFIRSCSNQQIPHSDVLVGEPLMFYIYGFVTLLVFFLMFSFFYV